jgi:histidine triad (HIT) family protein
MHDPSCTFCRIARGEISAEVVWEDEEHLAFLDINPVKPGHVLLIPREHVPWVDELPAESHARLFARVRELAGPVARAAGAPRTALAVEGFGVPHAHVHLIPVWKSGDLDPCRQRPASDDELRLAAGRLRAEIGRVGVGR